MKKNIKVSIIVPAYNEEKNIGKCLESLLKQSLKDIQIIVVDDGSVDNTYKICEYYRERSEGKIEIIRQHNEGLGPARNKGILYAKGNYIGFVDADDWVDSNMYLELYNSAQQYSADIVVCDIYKYYALDRKLEYIKIINGEDGKLDIKNYLLEGKYPQIALNKLYRADIWKGYRFNNIYFEDIDLVMAIISNVHTLVYLSQPLYYYHRHNGTISTDYSGVKYFDKFIAYDSIIKKVNKNFQQETIYWIAKNCLECIEREELYVFRTNFIDYIRENRNLFLNNLYLKKSDYWNNICKCIEIDLIARNIYCNAKIENNFSWGKDYIKDFNIFLLDDKEKTVEVMCLKSIWEKGGFYINQNIKFNMPIGSLRYYETILFWETDNTICLDVVGGKCNSRFLGELLSKGCEIMDIKEEIRKILVEYGVVFNGMSQLLKNDVMIYEKNVFLKYFQTT